MIKLAQRLFYSMKIFISSAYKTIRMSKKSNDIFNEIKENFPEEWKEILEDAENTKNKISSFVRELPAEIYGLVRDEIIARLLLIEKPSLAILNFVVDANIIVKDAFRVGFGRIFCPFHPSVCRLLF